MIKFSTSSNIVSLGISLCSQVKFLIIFLLHLSFSPPLYSANKKFSTISRRKLSLTRTNKKTIAKYDEHMFFIEIVLHGISLHYLSVYKYKP